VSFGTKIRIMPLAFSTTSVLTLVLAVFTGFPVAHASLSTTVSGTITGCCGEFLSTRIVDDNFFGIFNATDFWIGGISGTCTDAPPGATLIAHHIDDPNTTINFYATQRCSVTTLGRTGTMFIAVTATINKNGIEAWHGSIIHGTGALTGIHGVLTRYLLDPETGIEAYSGEIHFDPTPS
jgi:hypothetical protein